MVFKDNELINTKRVNRIRRSQNIYRHRLWQAKGEYSYLFTVLTFAAAGQQFSETPLRSLVPCRSTLTSAGFRQYARTAGKFILFPAFIGHVVGVMTFGNMDEYRDLLRNSQLRKREFEQYKNDLYYT